MKVTYKSLTLEEALELFKYDNSRDDLFFDCYPKNSPQELRNLKHYNLDFSDSTKVNWFKREVEPVEEQEDEDKNAELIAEQTVKNIMRYFI